MKMVNSFQGTQVFVVLASRIIKCVWASPFEGGCVGLTDIALPSFSQWYLLLRPHSLQSLYWYTQQKAGVYVVLSLRLLRCKQTFIINFFHRKLWRSMVGRVTGTDGQYCSQTMAVRYRYANQKKAVRSLVANGPGQPGLALG